MRAGNAIARLYRCYWGTMCSSTHRKPRYDHHRERRDCREQQQDIHRGVGWSGKLFRQPSPPHALTHPTVVEAAPHHPTKITK